MKTIKADELKKILSGEPSATVINVLDRDAYRQKHIPGTINIPVSAPDFVDEVKNQVDNRDKPVVVYCASRECNASDKAADKLEKAGFSDVRDFAAGTKGWEEQGYQLEGKEATAAR